MSEITVKGKVETIYMNDGKKLDLAKLIIKGNKEEFGVWGDLREQLRPYKAGEDISISYYISNKGYPTVAKILSKSNSKSSVPQSTKSEADLSIKDLVADIYKKVEQLQKMVQ